MRLYLRYLFIGVLGLIFLVKPCFAEETKPRWFQGVEVYGGWGQANLKTKQDYHFSPLFVDFDFNLKSLGSGTTSNNKFAGLCQFQIEPFFSLVLQPNHNIEVGNSFLLKLGITPQTWEFQPYIRGGLGLIYITQHMTEQSTQLNFIEQVGVGAHYFFNKNTAFNFEVRFRHLSNADIKRPNGGIESYLTLCGLSYMF